jgi:serine/threonine-protein kinase
VFIGYDVATARRGDETGAVEGTPMNETRDDFDGGRAGVHSSLADRINQVRERYEAAWMLVDRGKPEPTLQDFLGDSVEPERSILLQALSAVDRAQRGRLSQEATNGGAATAETIVGESIPNDFIPTLRENRGPNDQTVAPTGILPIDRHAPTMMPTEAFGTMLDRQRDAGAEETVAPTAAFTRAGLTAGPAGMGDTQPLDASGVTAEMVEPKPPPKKGRGSRELPKVEGYDILGELGRGGMGVVYKAHHQKLDRDVALKMVIAGAMASQDQLDRFILEAQAVARLQHPDIVQVFEVGEHQGLPFFSLEFVEGGTLHQKLGGKPMAPSKAAELTMILAGAMQVAHNRNIIHRDLKPANILLTAEGLPKITDFGLAKKMEGDSQQTRDGAVMGTPSYMAPEQAWGRNDDIGPPADQYALGAILYELLVGHPPFVGASALDTLELARNTEPVPPTRIVPKIPVDLETICLKAMQKEIGKRYESCEALATDLQHFLEGKPIAARPVGKTEKAWRWCKRNPWVAGLSAALVLAMLSATGVSTYAAVSISHKNEEIGKQMTRAVKGEKLAIQNAQAEKAARDRADLNERTAKRNERIAKRNEQIASAAKLEAEASLKKAKEAKELADQQSAALLSTVFDVTKDVQEKFREVPALQEVRKNVLEIALRGANQVAGIASKSPERNKVLASIHMRLGDIFTETDHLDEARKEYQDAEGVIDELAAKNPDDLNFSKRFPAAVKNKLGDLEFRSLGNTESARHYYEQALQHRLDLVSLDAKDEGAKLAVANSYGLLASVELQLGNAPEAMKYYRKEMEWRGRLPEEVRSILEVQRQESGLEQKLGEAYVMLEDRGQAREHLERAFEIRDLIDKRNPGVPQFMRDVARAEVRLGDFELIDNDEPAGALALYEKSLDISRKIVEIDPVSTIYKGDLAYVLYRVAATEARLGKSVPSAEHFAECLKLRKALAMNPSAKISEIDLVLAEARCLLHKEAAERMDSVLLKPPSDVGVWFQATCGYALCYAAALGGKPVESLDPEVRETAKAYLTKALGSVKQAVDYGWKDMHALRTDPDLDAIRELPEYLEILRAAKPSPAIRQGN